MLVNNDYDIELPQDQNTVVDETMTKYSKKTQRNPLLELK